ncbi:MAG: hypothetical protein M1421_06260 [Candidatus Eremiobacteraeota bacterium]|jgi:hypothetical protein|nr:hypothetical protein [Candidatus Eremiobacteraeota bacterium]MCL5054496.1 hypothetical protein [Bacillota bacterium]
MKRQWRAISFIFIVLTAFIMGILVSPKTSKAAFRYPNIHKIRIAARKARASYNWARSAKPVFGGHRAQAMSLLQQAISQLHQAIIYRKSHLK